MIMNDLGMDTTMAHMLTWVDGLTLPAALVIQRPHDRFEVLHANAAWADLNSPSADRMSGRGVDEVFPAPRAARMKADYSACLNGSGPVTFEDCITRDGQQTRWQTTLSRVTGFEAPLILSLSIAQSERQSAENGTADISEEMAARLEEVRLFSTIAAHDARSPLATVAGLIDLVRADFKDRGDGKAELLELASATVAQALEQIGGTLRRARMLGEDTEAEQVFEVGQICRDIAAMVDPENTLDICVPEARVQCDRMVLQMGLRNLISNAARHCRSRITIRIGEDRAQGHIRIDVTDDGAGLPEGLEIGDLIRRAEGADDASGFGLSAIAKLMRQRGGDLDLLPAQREDGLSGAGFRLALRGRILGGAAPHTTARSLAEPAQA